MMFGAYVSDDQTIEYYLYRILQEHHIYDYEVVNAGLMDPNITLSGKLSTEAISDEDIIIYWALIERDIFEDISRSYPNVKIGSDWTQAYNGLDNPAGNVFNDLHHCNCKINERVADIIYHDIKSDLQAAPDQSDPIRFKPLRNYYISWDIVQYYREYKEAHQLTKPEGADVIGAIVMNCNPFTKGHRYLIEYACARVDYLYIFVVEENASQFQFEDRINMVKLGTADLRNVYVMPSGKYIISKETFAQYFEKDALTDVHDMDYDLHIFADVVAKEFAINVRYVGEEPFDIVTKKYNETMKRILPEAGVEVVEIPRLKNAVQETISASLARKYINEKRYDKLENYLPESTILYLRKR